MTDLEWLCQAAVRRRISHRLRVGTVPSGPQPLSFWEKPPPCTVCATCIRPHPQRCEIRKIHSPVPELKPVRPISGVASPVGPLVDARRVLQIIRPADLNVIQGCLKLRNGLHNPLITPPRFDVSDRRSRMTAPGMAMRPGTRHHPCGVTPRKRRLAF